MENKEIENSVKDEFPKSAKEIISIIIGHGFFIFLFYLVIYSTDFSSFEQGFGAFIIYTVLVALLLIFYIVCLIVIIYCWFIERKNSSIYLFAESNFIAGFVIIVCLLIISYLT